MFAKTNLLSLPEDTLLTVNEVGTWLNVDDTTVRRWIKNEILQAVQLPHSGKRTSYRITVAQLRKAIHSPSVTEDRS